VAALAWVGVAVPDAARLADVDRPEDLARYAHAVPAPEIDVHALDAARQSGAYVLDVRTPEEHTSAHVEGVVLIPLAELPERVEEVPDDAGTVYVICQTGVRSARAAEWLNRQGYDAVNVAGGTSAWIDAGKPVESGG
jgi:rhodanese-related sulfurtransferase